MRRSLLLAALAAAPATEIVTVAIVLSPSLGVERIDPERGRVIAVLSPGVRDRLAAGEIRIAVLSLSASLSVGFADRPSIAFALSPAASAIRAMSERGTIDGQKSLFALLAQSIDRSAGGDVFTETPGAVIVVLPQGMHILGRLQVAQTVWVGSSSVYTTVSVDPGSSPWAWKSSVDMTLGFPDTPIPIGAEAVGAGQIGNAVALAGTAKQIVASKVTLTE